MLTYKPTGKRPGVDGQIILEISVNTRSLINLAQDRDY